MSYVIAYSAGLILNSLMAMLVKDNQERMERVNCEQYINESEFPDE